MCVPLDSEPPIAPIAGAAVSHELLELEASDGNRLAAFVALPAYPPGAGVVVLPDVRGLFHFYEELALRLAECGIAAITIDYFGRTAGASQRDDEFPYMDHVVQTTAEGVQADVDAAMRYLRSSRACSCRNVFTVGFCFGGRHSWLTAARDDLAGAIGFYGVPGPGKRDGVPGPTQRAGELKAPILALMGGADEAIPAEDIAEFEGALQANGVEHDVVTYEGAPHSFFDRRFEEHADASADAWKRVLAFVRERSAVTR
jgi:carboxymethylenebutenolidase